MKLQAWFDRADTENRIVMLSMVEKDCKARLLDCGCGDGSFTMMVARKAETSPIYGVEILEGVARLAEDKGIQVFRANLNEKLPIDSEIFDAVIANQIIEHLHETDGFLREAYRVLKPGAYAIFSTPNLASLHSVFALFLGRQPFSAHVSNEVIVGTLFNPLYTRHQEGRSHLRLFTYSGLTKLLEHHGFRIDKAVGVGYYPFPTSLARLLCKIDRRHAVYLTIKVRK